MKYENLDNVISLVQKFGENSLIAKLDIEDALRSCQSIRTITIYWDLVLDNSIFMTDVYRWVVAHHARLLRSLVKLYSDC